MPTATFDTRKFANMLKAAGVPDKQAEGQAGAFAEIIQVNLKDLATKDDLKAVKDDLKGEIKAVKDDLTADLKAVQDLLTRDIVQLRKDTD